MCQECATLAVCERCENEVDEELQEVAGEQVCQSCADDSHTCERCSEGFFEDGHTINGDRYCDSCWDDRHECEHCGLETWDDLTTIAGEDCCDACRERARTCDRCNRDTFRVYDVDEEDWCESCRENNAYYWDSDGSYHSEPESSQNGPIYDRHNHRGERMSGAWSGNYVGVELEVIPTIDREELAEQVNDLGDLHCEEDSSLDDKGFEIVTDYGEIEQVLKLCGRIARVVDGDAKSHDTTCCGLHVHISRNSCSQYEIARLVIFWNSPGNLPFLRRFSRRKPNTYCKIKDVDGKSEAELAAGKDRYEVVNVMNRETLEIRAFRGTTRKSTLLACVQLASLTWEFAKDHSIPDTSLTAVRFVKWVQERPERAEHVIGYLKLKGVIRCA